MKNKKAQIDIALTIGSIIVPVAVILGALIFSWAMISPTSNAGRIASVISYDIATMADIAYSVPENVMIRYSPPSACRFESHSGEKLICFNGFMNITDYQLRAGTRDTYFPTINPGSDTPENKKVDLISTLDSRIQVWFDSETLKNKGFDSPTIASFSAFANLRDYGIVYKDPIQLKVDNGIIVQKTRTGFFDTLNPDTPAQSKDPLEQIVTTAHSLCPDSENNNLTQESSFGITLQPGYYLGNDNEELCLYKDRVTPNLANPEIVRGTLIYCFDARDIPGDCRFDLSVSGITQINTPAGTGSESIQVTLTLETESDSDENIISKTIKFKESGNED